ncbi:MAG: chemotaxis protein CheW [Kangiellaceae bacterium]|nr:chemotaxis protein CheW [Kangiellaceae bacterium]MCW8998791.1 chemotaxis protein CheW [Kangiellaceae bacterium]MCW9016135.1 chemotaxis protein CheW [Kangiellaceae bacterium]
MAELMEKKEVGTELEKSERKIQQYLTFLMEKDEYGIDILAVQEIHGWIEPRPIPNTPDYIKGVVDWRGTVVPIIDLRVRFGYENVTYDKTTVVIILQACLENGEGRTVILGTVVDAVSDVHDVPPDNLRIAPSFGSKVDTRYIKGLAKLGDNMIVLLDLGKLVNLDDLNDE